MKQQLGFIGLGRMGKNMVLHLLEKHVTVVGYNRTRGVTEGFVKEASSPAFLPTYDIASLVGSLEAPAQLNGAKRPGRDDMTNNCRIWCHKRRHYNRWWKLLL
jgi:6-phosphogluconate dehydrogenase